MTTKISEEEVFLNPLSAKWRACTS